MPAKRSNGTRVSADAPPFEDACLDRVVSSLVFHHLEPEVVRATIPELRRVLKPGGSVGVLDMGHGGTHGLHGLHDLMAHFASHEHGNEDVASEQPKLWKPPVSATPRP